jgi:hypothetical protein
MLGVGGFLLYQPLTGWFWLVVAVAGWVALRWLGKGVKPMPGMDD